MVVLGTSCQQQMPARHARSAELMAMGLLGQRAVAVALGVPNAAVSDS